MGAVTTLAVTIAAAAGGVALYRFVNRQRREFTEIFNQAKARAGGPRDGKVIDYERDPASGVYKPKS